LTGCVRCMVRRSFATRRPPSPDPDRGCATRQEPGAAPALLARGSDAGRESGKLPPYPSAHHDAACGWRGFQYDLGREGSHSEQLIDYVRHHRGGCRRHYASSPIADFASLWNVRTGCHGATDFRRSPWERRSTSPAGCRTSVSRNICGTRPKPTRSSRTITGWTKAF
jgi:hypothetical protein